MKPLFLLICTTLSSFCFAQSTIELEFKTGSDDLAHRDFQKGLEIRVKVQGKPDVVLENANQGRNWANNSTKRITLPLHATTIATDIKEIILTRDITGNSRNNIEGSVADNWNLQQLIVKANIKRGSNTLKYNLLNEQGSNGKALFRFIYENRNQPNDGQEKGYSKSFPISNPTLVSGTAARPTIILKAIIKTGGDDLRGGNDNVDMLIKFKNNTANTFLPNINNGRNWRNFGVTRFEKTLPPTFDMYDIESIELRHTGGGGFAADNWYLDELKIILVVNNAEYVIMDKVEAPIHYFTGDTRKKIFRDLKLPTQKEYLK